LLPQGHDLPFCNGNRMTTVRMRHVDLGKQIGVLLEESYMLLQIVGDRFLVGFVRHSSTCHSPSNTVCAGPVISTGPPAPSQRIVSSPPRVRTRTVGSSRSRRIPATTAAQAPVPHAKVSPAPRSHTRRRMLARSTTCM